MSSKAEIIKDCMKTIRELELMIELDPDNNSLIKLLKKEQDLLETVKTTA